MSDPEYNPEGPELDDVFEQPVQCSECGDWHELNDSHFWTAYCECPITRSCRHGVCKKCYQAREAVHRTCPLDAPTFSPTKGGTEEGR